MELCPDTVTLLKGKSEKRRAVTFDEITLSDQPVEFHPNDVVLRTHISRKIQLKGCGLVSAAMDTVTEKEMALAMAKMGGMGILHRNLSPEEQSAQLNWVRKKIHFGGMLTSPSHSAPTCATAPSIPERGGHGQAESNAAACSCVFGGLARGL